MQQRVRVPNGYRQKEFDEDRQEDADGETVTASKSSVLIEEDGAHVHEERILALPIPTGRDWQSTIDNWQWRGRLLTIHLA